MKFNEKKCVESLRYLAATTISNANSGHTGISTGAATIFYSLFANSLKYSPSDPSYFNRDRFVMCAGHASALLYSTLHCFGYDYTMEDLKGFRKKGTKTKGHPSANPNLGVDATGGPLGQGIPMAVGMAIAERKLASKFNKDGFDIIDHYTYAFAGDGSMMEGMTNEASSLAGNLKLHKLIVLYDSNNITIEGETGLTFSENVLNRYKALGWNTLEVKDGNNIEEITRAIASAKEQKEKPTIIKINTSIGCGTPYEGNCKSHGMALNEADLKATKEKLGITTENFELDGETKNWLSKIVSAKEKEVAKEKKALESFKGQYPFEYSELFKWLGDYYSKNVAWENIKTTTSSEATRISGKTMLNRLAEFIPNLICGSADLADSTGCKIKDGGYFSAKNPDGRNICFGVREHAMASICNGIALHGGFRVACSTFMVFSDYMRHAIRMSALMKLNVIYVLTHDSIAVGFDGATHQPVEFNSMYRATPGLIFVRPADSRETKGAYQVAIESSLPTVIALTRQSVENNLPSQEDIGYGGYAIVKNENPQAVLIASGSELSLCVKCATNLKMAGMRVDVVSMPSTSLFDKMPQSYKDEVLNPHQRKRIFVEASNDAGLYKYIGLDGKLLGVPTFGYTATGEELMEDFGFTVENVERELLKLIKG